MPAHDGRLFIDILSYDQLRLEASSKIAEETKSVAEHGTNDSCTTKSEATIYTRLVRGYFSFAHVLFGTLL
jgi:hypothetical protein